MSKDQTSFVSALFDLSFDDFITTRIIKVLYVLLIAITALCVVMMVLGGLFTMFTKSFFGGLGTVLMAPIFGIVSLIVARVYTELIMVMFKIVENTTELVSLKKPGGQAG